MTVLLDSLGWSELLGGTKRADLFEPALKAERLIVPAIVLRSRALCFGAFGGVGARNGYQGDGEVRASRRRCRRRG